MKKIILTTCLFIPLITTVAQTNLINNGQLYISNHADTVFITGSLTNTSTANLNNAGGNLYVKQNLTNNQAGMVTGAGKLWSNGSTLQNIDGSQPFKTHNWIVDNASNIALQNRIEVGNGTAGTLSFINGKITSGTNLQDVTFNNGSTYTGYGNSRHIIGFCSKVGAANFTFPIGDGTYQADLDIANLSSNSTFQCKYFGNVYSILTVTAPLVSVFDKEYWILDRTAGTSGSNITLKWNDARKPLNHMDPTNIRAGHFTGTSWVSEGGTGSGNTPMGSVTSIMVNNYSPFTFASETNVLPILLNSIDVNTTTNCDAVIRWIANEDGKTTSYIVQKQVNNTWVNIGEQKSQTNTTNAQYLFTDYNTDKGNNYYRLAIKNYTGNVTYTAIKVATVNCKKEYIKVYPTLAKTMVNISVPQAATIIILNNNGQQMLQKQTQAGNNIVDVANYTNGLYLIKIKMGATTQSFKIMKY